MRRLILIAVLLTGCTTAPTIVSSTPQSVSIRYNPNFMARDAVTREAQAYCRNVDLNAVYVSDDIGFGRHIVNWNCVP